MKEIKSNLKSITERKSIAINLYFRDINPINLIPQEEETRLASIIKKGGKEAEKAKEQLINANLRFVISVANKYTHCGMDLDDLISEGNIGLVKAAEHYNVSQGVKFISYAVWWIRQSILSAIANNANMIRIPVNKQKVIDKFHYMQNDVMLKEQRGITVREFAEQNGYDENTVGSIIDASVKPSSVDAPIADDSDTTFLNTMTSDSITDKNLDIESLRYDLNCLMLNILDDNEITVLRYRFGLGCQEQSLEFISTMIGKSRERTRQLLYNALDKLRKSPCSSKLLCHLAA